MHYRVKRIISRLQKIDALLYTTWRVHEYSVDSVGVSQSALMRTDAAHGVIGKLDCLIPPPGVDS